MPKETDAAISQLPLFLRPKLRLFLSVDIVGSTQFKQRGALSGDKSDWLPTFIQFYRDIERDFFAQWEAYKASAAKHQWPATDPPEFWKGNGDEVIYTKVLRDHREAFACTFSWIQAVRKYRAELHSKHKGLDLKATAWLAGFPVNNSEVIFRSVSGGAPSSEITEATIANYTMLEEYYSDAPSKASLIRDFIGPSIDLGFRLAQHSTPQRMVLSLDLALMITHVTAPFEHFPKLVFGYGGRQPLRGAMGGYPYPIFWIDMLEDDTLAAAENDLSRQQRPAKDNVWRFCEEFIKNNSEFLIRPFIWPEESSSFNVIPDGHIAQLQMLYKGWQSGKANEGITEAAVRGDEPPGEPASGEVSPEALDRLVSGIAKPPASASGETKA